MTKVGGAAANADAACLLDKLAVDIAPASET